MNWVNGKGGVKRWEGDFPDDTPLDENWAIADVLERLIRNLATPFDPLAQIHPFVFCPDCDCALGREGASCPNCLVWAERNAVKTSWDQVFMPWTDDVSKLWDVA